MRKLFVAVAALGMLLTSCAKDDVQSGGNGAVVSFNIAQPTIASRMLGTEDATKAYGTGYTVEDLQYAIFEAEVDAATGDYSIRDNGQKPISGVVDGFFEDISLKNTLSDIRLVRGKHYIALFFAQADAVNGHWNVNWDDQSIELKNVAALKAQDETMDAFFKRVDFKVDPVASTQTFDAVLTRPFAQVNVLTDDAVEAQLAGLDVYQTSITVEGVYTKMNLLDGKVENETSLTFGMAEKGNKFMKVNTTDYDLLSMNYLLVNEYKLVDITFNYNEDATVAGNDNTVFEAEFDAVPVQRNYRTNIMGPILTSAVSFIIEINPIFVGSYGYNTEKTPEEMLVEAAAAGGEYILGADVVLNQALEITKDFKLNLNGKTITYANPDESAYTAVFMVRKGTLTIEGEGNVVAKGEGNIAVWAGRGDAENDGKVIIKGGNFSNDSAQELIYTNNKGVIEIYGGTFQVAEEDQTSFATPQYAVLNLYGNGQTGNDIIVYGGTFHNFNPSDNVSENPKKDFCAEGYISKSTDGKVWTVSKMTAEDKLVAEATKGGSYTLAEDMVLSQTLVVEKDLTLNLNGKTLSNKDYTMRSATPTTDVIIVAAGATLTLEGDGVVEAVTGNDGYAVVVEGTVYIKGGTYKAGVDQDGAANAVIYARGEGKVYVEGGYFPNDANSAFVLNKKDADRNNTVIEVKGGKFVNFDPANNAAEGAGTNFMAKGYTTEAAEVDGKTVYTVVAAKTVLATPAVETAVEGNEVTLTWKAVENAYQYAVTVGEETDYVEGTTYVFPGEYETEYTFTVVAVAAADSAYLDSEAAQVTATTEAEPSQEVVYTTVDEFLAAQKDESATAPMYTLKGTITAVANTTYGNFDLTDDTGTVYIYGLCSPDGATNKYWATSGAKLGDDIVIKTIRTDFNGTPQGKNAWFVELVSPGTRAFYTVDPAAVDFTSAGGEQDIEVSAYNTTAAVTATSDNAAFAVEVNGYVVTVTAAANELEEDVTGNISITVGDLAPTVVKATLAAKPAAGVVEGGSDDFHTISSTNTSYVSGKTAAGWAYANCAIFKGGTSDSSPAFKMIGDASNRALCMNGKTSAKGTITSPTFTTGCGTLTFNYGLPFGDTKIKFQVDIIQNGAVVKTFTVDKSSATKYTKYSHEEVVNVAGEFQIKFSNLSPSNSTSNKDRTAIWDVEWTGYVAE